MASFDDGRNRRQTFRARFGAFFQNVPRDINSSTKNMLLAFNNFIKGLGGNLKSLSSSAKQRLRLANTGSTQILKDKAIDLIRSQTQSAIKENLERYAKGRLDKRQLQQQLQRIIQRSSLASAIIGVGGFANLTENVIKAVQRQVARQFEYLDGFIQRIEGRNITWKNRNDAMMYANSVHSIAQTAYRQFRLDQAEEQGKETPTERRVTRPGENCADCIAYENMGCQPLGTLPAIGQGSVCGSNCNCQFIYDCQDTIFAPLEAPK